MAVREGNWWSRAWGVVTVLAFAVTVGAAVYEAALIAPLWSLTPPKSVLAWAAVPVKPDSSTLFHSLVAVIAVASSMSWISGILTRGWRRWWLTLMLLASGALVAVTALLVFPSEQQLFGAQLRDAAKNGGDSAWIVAATNDWIRAVTLRFAVLLVGWWAAYRAQLAGMLADRPLLLSASDAGDDAFVLAAETPAGRSVRGRRARDFAFGDEGEPELSIGDESILPRERWRRSLPGRRGTAKK